LIADRFPGKNLSLRRSKSVKHSAPNLPIEPESLPAAEAFKELYDKTVNPVAAWLVRLGVWEGEWKDAIQEIYLEAWRSWGTFDPALGIREQWLHGIAVNVAGRFRKRRASKARWEEPESGDLDIASTSPSAEDYMLLNDRARFTVQLFEAITTLPLTIMIAHDMNGEHMKDIAARHQLSLSEAYRLRDQAKYLFTEGYEREQEKRRKLGALILPFSALSLLKEPHALPELSSGFKVDLWDRIAQKIGATPGGSSPSHDPPAQPSMPAASVPPMPLASAAPFTKGAGVRALRAALFAHPMAAPALIFASGAIAGVLGTRLFDEFDKDTHAPIAHEVSAAPGVGAATVPVASASAPLLRDEPIAPPRASNSADTKRETGPAGQLTPAEAAQFDVVRATFANQDNDNVLKAIQGYLKTYPRGHFAADCEKMRIQTLIRAGRREEARQSIARLRQRSPKSPLLKELESTIPSP
jgi:DNA-directed RNA polymerase specialized sigma24 family protein